MGKGFWGPKHFVDGIKKADLPSQELIVLQLKIEELQEQLKKAPKEIKVVEEKLVEIVKTIEVPIERIIEKEVIKEFPVMVEKFTEKPVEVFREIEKIVEKRINKVPMWMIGIMGFQFLTIVYLLIK